MSLSRKTFLKSLPGIASLPTLLSFSSGQGIKAISDKKNKFSSQKKSKNLFELQQQFLDLRFGMFIHFNIPTYCDADWPDPNTPPEIFNPQHLDCNQWAMAAKLAGMTYGCLTTKHHSGFCIWPTATTSYSVANSSFQGDVVKNYAEAFRKNGIKVCLYYSILDIHHNIRKGWIKESDVTFIKNQLTELLTSYGEITALIIDGWDASWSRISYEEIPFSEIYYHVKSLQPNCLISDHNAAKYPREELFYTDFKHYEQNAGQKISKETNRLPAQAGIPINRSWFWKINDPINPVKDPKILVEENLIPLNNAHCNFILNIAPNRDGRIDPNVIAALKTVGDLWQHPGPVPKLPEPHQPIIASNLAKFKKANSSWSNDNWISDFGNDDNFSSFWQSNKEVSEPWYEIIFDMETEFNMILFIEMRNVDAKSRIREYELQYHDGLKWITIAKGNDPERVQIHRFKDVKSKKVRIFISKCETGLGITEFCVYDEF